MKKITANKCPILDRHNFYIIPWYRDKQPFMPSSSPFTHNGRLLCGHLADKIIVNEYNSYDTAFDLWVSPEQGFQTHKV